jgi:hypothetical protein
VHTLWSIVQGVFVLAMFIGIGVVGVWGFARGESNIGRMFGENSKSHWYSKDYDRRDF